MAIGSLSPTAIQEFNDANGAPLAGGKLHFYLAGTTTPTPAYADVGLTTPLPNPVILDAAGRAPELFLAALSYKQVLKTAGDVTIWTADNIITPTALRSVQSTISLTGTQDNVPVAAGVITFLQCDNVAPLTIGGFAGGTPGQILIVRAGQTSPVHLLNWTNSTSVVGNTLVNFVGSGPTSIVSGGIAMYVYGMISGTLYWQLVAHEQGAWIPVPFNAANFTANAGTWTVPNPTVDVSIHTRLSGTSLMVTAAVTNSVVSSTPTELFVSNLQYAVRSTVVAVPVTVHPSGLPYEAGNAHALAASRQISFQRATLQPWPAGAATHVTLQISLDVQ